MSSDAADLFVLPHHLGSKEREARTERALSSGFDEIWKACNQVVAASPDDDLAWKAAPWRGIDYKTRGALIAETAEDLLAPVRGSGIFEVSFALLTPFHLRVIEEFESTGLESRRDTSPTSQMD